MARSLSIFCLVLILTLSFDALAGPKNQTPSKRFKPFRGTWVVTKPSNSELTGLKVVFKTDKQESSVDFNFVTDAQNKSIGGLAGRPGRLNVTQKKKLTALYEFSGTPASRVGNFGAYSFSFPKKGTFSSPILTFHPNKKFGLQPFTVRLEHVKDSPDDTRKISHKFRQRGKAKPGKKMGGTFTIINRGPGIVQEGMMETLVAVSGPVDSLSIGKKKRFKTCREVFSGFIICPSQYLGPHGKKTFGTISFSADVSSSAKDGDEISFISTSAPTSTNTAFKIDADTKTVKVKVSDKGGNSSALSGLFTRLFSSFAPPRTSTYRFKKKNGVIVGVLVTASSADSQYKLGTLIYKNMRPVGNTFVGKFINRIQNGKLIYVDITLRPSGNSFIDQFGNVMLTRK